MLWRHKIKHLYVIPIFTEQLSGIRVKICLRIRNNDRLTTLDSLEQSVPDNGPGLHCPGCAENGDVPVESGVLGLMPGKAKTRNAIRLLSIMGYDSGIIRRAEEMAARFEKTGKWEQV